MAHTKQPPMLTARDDSVALHFHKVAPGGGGGPAALACSGFVVADVAGQPGKVEREGDEVNLPSTLTPAERQQLDAIYDKIKAKLLAQLDFTE